jgi:predicted small metal-binding protein
MDQFRCADVVPGCDAGFEAPSAVELLRRATVHAWTAHGLVQPHLPARTTAKVLAAIRPVR